MLEARTRRDALAAADDDYWAALMVVDIPGVEMDNRSELRAAIQKRYEHACLRAVTQVSFGRAQDQLIRDLAIAELSERVDAIAFGGLGGSASRRSRYAPQSAALGAKITDALVLYTERIAARFLVNKSEQQRRQWREPFARGVRNFVHVISDKPIGTITRSDATKFYGWWLERLKPKIGAKTLSGATANRDIWALRKFFREYHEYFGEKIGSNPFAKLSFKQAPSTPAPVIANDWVRSRLLVPGAFDQMSDEFRYLIFTMIETGARTSEIIHLQEEDIVLNTDFPFIRIRPSKNRELKTTTSQRDIPLVGVALEAMRRQREGFPYCCANSAHLSGYLLRGLRDAELLPSKEHRIYSFRHSFEKRMLEAGLDYEFRCRMMGHSLPRPNYGDGGSMEFRQSQLLKIAHPYDEQLFSSM